MPETSDEPKPLSSNLYELERGFRSKADNGRQWVALYDGNRITYVIDCYECGTYSIEPQDDGTVEHQHKCRILHGGVLHGKFTLIGYPARLTKARG